jgi:hypothetical protein
MRCNWGRWLHLSRGQPDERMTAVTTELYTTAAEVTAASSCRMQPDHKIRDAEYTNTLTGYDANTTAAPLPFSTSVSIEASLHMLLGGRQSCCFKSAILPLAGASTTNTHVPLPRELRTVALIVTGATTVERCRAAHCLQRWRKASFDN